MVFQHLFQEVFEGSQVCTFYYASLIFLQKLPNKTQNSGPKTVLCRHKINNLQWSLLGVHYVSLKKKDEEEYNLMEFKTSYLQDVPGVGVGVGGRDFILIKIPNSIWSYY